MRLEHFEVLQPVCPRCRWERNILSPLKLAKVVTQMNDIVVEGFLHCSDSECRLEFPIIDSIPIILRNIRQYINDNLFHITNRSDLSNDMQSLLGDCAGPSTLYDATRQHLSSYGWDHYGDLANKASVSSSQSSFQPGSVIDCLEKALQLVPEKKYRHTIDLGCSVGRTTFELSKSTEGLVLGVDLNFSMLRIAQNALQQQRIRFPLRRIGIVYDEMDIQLEFEQSNRVDFWACDAIALPFSEQKFELLTAFNLLDSVNAPSDLLSSIALILKKQSHALLSTPYDWSPAATPLENWIGGHSQRGPDHGAAEPLIKSLLMPRENIQSLNNLKLIAEINDFPWSVRVHDRSSTLYSLHIMAVEVI